MLKQFVFVDGEEVTPKNYEQVLGGNTLLRWAVDDDRSMFKRLSPEQRREGFHSDFQGHKIFIVEKEDGTQQNSTSQEDEAVQWMAKSREAQKRAQARYEATGAVKERTKCYILKCHIVHDGDIIDAMERHKDEGKNTYLKRLVRADIANQCRTAKPVETDQAEREEGE